jgi:hypothetical protein
MTHKDLLLALSLSVFLALIGQASAQIIVPGGVPQPNANTEALKKVAEALAQRGGKPALHWGGARLEKVSPELQTQLGLEENAGLVVAAVDANSIGAKAGLKANDVLVKIGAKDVPGDPVGFANLVKDLGEKVQIDLVVVRKGKQETIKGAKMPALVQSGGIGGGGIGGRGGLGGIGIGGAPGFPGMPGIGGGLPGIGFGGMHAGKVKKFHIELEINGADVIRDQDGDTFTGTYAKGDLKISVTGKLENGQAKLSEITVQEGKESKKYTTSRDVPAKHHDAIRQLLPSPLTNLMIFPAIPNLQGFPGLHDLPGFDNKR